jgi:hypothetical protein
MVIRKVSPALQPLDRKYADVSLNQLQEVEDASLTIFVKQLICPENNGREY